MKHTNLRNRQPKTALRPVSRACLSLGLMLAGASFTPLALAGAGWADNTDNAGNPFKQGTFFANSPQGIQIDYSPGAAVGATRDTGIALRKFVDNLPMVDGYTTNPALVAHNPSLLGKHIPTAIKETVGANGHSVSFPDADYYEIAVVEYREQLHADLPAVVKTGNVVTGGTTLRGYVQIATANLPSGTSTYQLFYLDGTAILDNKGNNVYGVGDKPHYLGPIIDSQSGVPVRLRFDNYLPTGRFDPLTNTRGGDIFIPTDVTVPGSGLGPLGAVNPAAPADTEMYSQNRAMIHLHGGDTPWISDGQPHSWITPSGETGTPYLRGETTQNVPDMPDFGAGTQTYFYPNNQSSRMEWYHDHTYAATRLNVYAGVVSAFLIHDATEAKMKAAGGALAGMDEIPLIYETKTFVPKDVNIEDAKWNVDANGNPKQRWGTYGDLWFPHVYEANQNPNSIDGTNPAGRWDYGPWFWPVFPAPLAMPAGDVDNASAVQEAFADTPLINGVAYPNLNVEPKSYRFRLLNADGQRYVNLGLYVAEPLSIGIANGGLAYSAATTAVVPADDHGVVPVVKLILNTMDGSIVDVKASAPAGQTLSYTTAPIVTLNDPVNVHDPIANPASVASLVVSVNTEVPMVPASLPGNISSGLPTVGNSYNPDGSIAYYSQNTYDGRPGGIPDPAAAGPNIIQIGTEGGFLAMPNVIPSTPVSYQQLRRIVTVLNVLDHGLYLGPAERADLVIDFSQYAGKTLILYNDCPAPNPGFDARVDYYTGDADMTASGGAPSTLPGQGPNTRTMMRIHVGASQFNGAAPAAMLDTVLNSNNLPPGVQQGGPFVQALPAAFAASQEVPVVTESWQNAAYGKVFQDNLARIYAGTTQQPYFTFSAPGAQTVTGFQVVSAGTGYKKTPTVTLVGGLDPAFPNAVAGTAHAVLDVAGQRLASIVLDTAGGPYISAPSVVLNAGVNTGGIGAAATVVTSTTKSWKVQNKGIQELFDQNYGRMNATFSVELPFTSVLTQTTIPVGYVDPPTEQIADGETQIWKVTHNGVDTHVVHFHLFNVQVINRVGWDGTVVALDPAEFGWKETVKMNPLEDIYMAIKPKSPKAPFGVPQSVRPLDPTQPLGVTSGFSQVDPNTGLATTVTNEMHNFNWEYIWHCHILGHEENDFMRVISFDFKELPPDALGIPTVTSVTLASSGTGNLVSWIDPTPAGDAATPGNKKNELGFLVQRSNDGGTTWNSNVVNGLWVNPALPATIPQSAAQATQNPAGVLPNVVAANATSWIDPVANGAANAQYKVVAFNSAGYSVGSQVAGLPGAISSVSATDPVWDAAAQAFSANVSWVSATPPTNGFLITRSGGLAANGTALADVTFFVPATDRSFIDNTLQQISLFTYKVQGVSGGTLLPTVPTPTAAQFAVNPAPTAAQLAATGASISTSAQIQVQTNFAPPPTVTGMTAVALAPTLSTVPVQLSWSTPASTANVTAYNITRQQVDSTGAPIPNTLPVLFVVQQVMNPLSGTILNPTVSFTDQTAAQNTAYRYTVVASNGSTSTMALLSAAVPGGTTTITTPYTMAPLVSGAVVTLGSLYNVVNINWNAPQLNTNVTGLQISRNNVVLTTLTGTPTSYVDTTALQHTSYTYSLRWVNGNQMSASVNAVPTVNTPYALVSAVSALSSTQGASYNLVNLAWTLPAAAPGYLFDSIQVLRNGAWVATLPANATSYNDTLASQTTTYTYTVQLMNTTVAGAGVTTTLTTPFGTAPDMAGLLSVANAWNQVSLSWNAAAPGTESGVQILRNGVLLTTLLGSPITWTDITTAQNTAYTYSVLWVNGTVTGKSGVTTVTTPYAPAPAASGAAAFATAYNSVTMTWSPAAAGSETGGQVLRNGAVIYTFTGTQTSYTDTTTAQNTAYTYGVQWLNGTVNPAGAVSNAASVTTPYAPANAVTGLTATGNGGAVTVSWSPSTPSTGYRVERAPISLSGVVGSYTVLSANWLNGTTYSDTSAPSASIPPEYSYRVTALNGPTNASASVTTTVFDVAAPAAPVLNSATVGAGAVTLSWTRSATTATTGYSVQRSTDGGLTFSTLANVALRATVSYMDTTVSAGNSYQYRLYAVDTVGTMSVQSATPSATLTAAYLVPNVPTALTLTVNATTKVPTITWTAPAAITNGAAVTSYNVYNNGVQLNAAPVTGTTYTGTVALVVGSNNSFTVKAVNPVGSSTFSSPVNDVFAVPTAPTIGTVTATSATRATVSWTPATVVSGAPAITGYAVYNGTTLLATAAANATTYNATIALNTVYNFSVVAVNLAGNSVASSTVTLSDTVPATVAAPTAAFVSPTQTTVSWTAPAAVTGAPAITGYNVYNGNGNTPLNATPLAATATSYTATTAVGTTYNFNVRAVNAVGSSAVGTSTTVVNTVPVAPVIPTLVSTTLNTVTPVTTDTVTINWTPVTNTVNGQPVTTFYIDYATNTGFTTGLVTQPVTVPAGVTLSGAQSATFSAVARGTTSPTAPTATAYFRVRAANVVGTSANGATLTVARTALK